MAFSGRALVTLTFLLQDVTWLSARDFQNDTRQERTVCIGSMAPMTGKRAWWGAGIPLAIEMAFDDINKRDNILKGYKLTLLSQDTQGDTGLGNKVFYDFLTEKRVRLIFGPSRSNVAESAGATAKHYNMIQVSASAASGELSKNTDFPLFFRTVPALSASNRTFVTIAKTFGWTRVAILYQSRELFESAATSLREECNKSNIRVISYGSFLTDPTSQIKHLKDIDARIIFGFFSKSTKTMCEIYKHRMHGRKYAWIIHTPDRYGWWKRTFSSVDCTPEQVNEGAKGILSVNYMWLSKSNKKTESGMSPKEFSETFLQRAKSGHVNDTGYKGFAYDAAWLVALALNTTEQDLGSNVYLDTPPFGDKNFSDAMKKNLLTTEFVGVTSFVKLNDKGDRSGVFEISQLKGTELQAIGSHEVQESNLTIYPGTHFQWEGGSPPADRQSEMNEMVAVSTTVFIFTCSMSALGICLAFSFLFFNVKNRKKRLIKMSSPKLNNAIIMGCILSYVSVILFAFTGTHLTTTLCKLRSVTLCVGFTLAFGSMFSKTWRVHRITRIISAKKKVIKDSYLFGIIGVLLLIDATILLIWNIVDPVKKTTKYLPSYNDSEDESILHVPYTFTCEFTNMTIWLGVMYSYKGVLLLFGLFLAWETRNVKIPALNDSHHIGMAVYNVVIVCIVGIPVAMFVHSKQFETSFIVTAICIISSTTSTLCIVFVPKVAALRKSVQKKDYRIRTCTLSSLEHHGSNVYDSKNNCSCYYNNTFNKEEELQRLRDMLAKLQLEKQRRGIAEGCLSTQL